MTVSVVGMIVFYVNLTLVLSASLSAFLWLIAQWDTAPAALRNGIILLSASIFGNFLTTATLMMEGLNRPVGPWEIGIYGGITTCFLQSLFGDRIGAWKRRKAEKRNA